MYCCSKQMLGCDRSGQKLCHPFPALPGVSSAGGHPAGAATSTRQSHRPNSWKRAKFNVLVMGLIFILDTFVIKAVNYLQQWHSTSDNQQSFSAFRFSFLCNKDRFYFFSLKTRDLNAITWRSMSWFFFLKALHISMSSLKPLLIVAVEVVAPEVARKMISQYRTQVRKKEVPSLFLFSQDQKFY